MPKSTTSAVAILRRRSEQNPELLQLLAQERVHNQVAGIVVNERLQARFTQAELAERAGTSQPTITRLEDANYRGHSLNLLVRVACAVGKEVQISFVRPSSLVSTLRDQKWEHVGGEVANTKFSTCSSLPLAA